MRQVARFVGIAGLVCVVASSSAGCGSSGHGTSVSASGAGQVGVGGDTPAASGAAGVGASAGASGNGGGTASAGSSGSGGNAGLALGDSKTEACIAYALAQCTRRAQCGGYSAADCLSFTFSCPDVVFAAGSTRTVAGLQACANELLAFPCQKINNYEFPACVSAGKRAAGEACAFSSQCASLECNFTTRDQCATCATVLALGDDCSAPNTACDLFLTCQAGRCAPSTDGFGPSLSIGQDCSAAGDNCAFGSYCSSATHLCTAAPAVGASCAASHVCQGGYCSSADQTCAAYPGLNQPCGVPAGSSDASACAPGLVCSTVEQSSGTCVPAPAAGQPCYRGVVSSLNGDCDSAAWCDFNQQPNQCMPKGAPGTVCKSDLECQTGAYCLCADGTSSCTSQTCNVVHLRDEACGAAPNVICHPGFACSNGKCQPRDAQGTFGSCENP